MCGLHLAMTHGEDVEIMYLFDFFHSMSVYHSIRSMQQSSEEDESVEQDDMVILAIDHAVPTVPAIHPASDRNSGHVSHLRLDEIQ